MSCCFRPDFALKPHSANCRIKMSIIVSYKRTISVHASMNNVSATTVEFTSLRSRPTASSTDSAVYYGVEMTMGMGFPTGMGIPWDSHRNRNWWQNWEWEWEGMENNLYGNGNGHYSHGNQFPSADTAYVIVQFIETWEFCFWWQLWLKTISMTFYANQRPKLIIFSATIFLVSVL